MITELGGRAISVLGSVVMKCFCTNKTNGLLITIYQSAEGGIQSFNRKPSVYLLNFLCAYFVEYLKLKGESLCWVGSDPLILKMSSSLKSNVPNIVITRIH